jgi:Dolichyl-phosphate-mannose-protein mannosyltransferase
MASAESTPIRLLREARSSAAARRATELVHSVPLALAVLVAAGVALRLAVWLVYRPAVMSNADTVPYVAMANLGLFGDPVRPAGYAMFLRAVHFLSDDLDVTILVQHLLGIGTALLLYAAVRRVEAPRWVALAGAAAVLLSLDQVVLEHVVLTEALFTFGFTLALYACVRALGEPRPVAGSLNSRHLWLLGAGVTLGLCAWVRGVAVPLAPFLALWVALAIPGRWWPRVGRGALAEGAAVVVVLGYFVLNDAKTDTFALTQSSGWALYSRIAPVADCDRFNPPPGTSSLCEQSEPGTRFGPDFYGWEPGSPAVRLFGGPPEGNEQLSAFAREAIEAQPLQYGRLVVKDMARYFIPNYHLYAYGGPGYDAIDIGRRDPVIENDVHSWIDGYYPGEPLVIKGGVGTVSEVQDWLRVQPILMMVALIAALGGAIFARGRQRSVLLLLIGGALLLLLVPSATASWNARYAVPAGGPLIAAGALGAWLLAGRFGVRRPGRSAVARAE